MPEEELERVQYTNITVDLHAWWSVVKNNWDTLINTLTQAPFPLGDSDLIGLRWGLAISILNIPGNSSE